MKKMIIMCLGATVLSGCVCTELAVKNTCPEMITVTSGHTGRSYSIRSGKTATVPHTAGSVSVITASGKKWEYPAVCSVDGTNESYFIFWHKVVKSFEIKEPDVPNK
jgi:hypothetical protein